MGLDVAGLLMAWIFAVGVIVTGPGGAAVDRFGARLVTLVACLVHMVGVGILAFADTVPKAIVATTLMGVSGVTWPAFNAMVAAIVEGPLRQQYFGVNFALVNLGIGLGGVVSGLYVDVTRPETFTVIYLVDAASLLIPVVLLLGPLRHVHARADKPEDTTGIPTSYLQILRQPAMAWLLLLTFIGTFVGYGQMEAGFPAFAREASEVSTRTIGWAFAANTAVIVAAQFLVLRRIAGHRRTRVLMVMSLVWVLAWTVLGLTGLVAGTLIAAFGVVLFHVLFGFGETMFQPTIPAMTNDLAPDHLRGRYNALSSGFFQLGGIAGPVVAGFMLRHDQTVAFIVHGGGRLPVADRPRAGARAAHPAEGQRHRRAGDRGRGAGRAAPPGGRHGLSAHREQHPRRRGRRRARRRRRRPGRPTRTASAPAGRRTARARPAGRDPPARAPPQGRPAHAAGRAPRPPWPDAVRGRGAVNDASSRPSGVSGAGPPGGRPVSSWVATTPAAYTSCRGSGGGAGDLLGRHVAAGADAAGCSREPGVAARDRDAEVAEADPRPAGAGGLEEEVARLDVAVHQPRRVHRHQGLEHLVQHDAHVAVGQRTVPREQLLDVAAAHQVHGEEVVRRRVGRLHDVAVPHPQSPLADEPLEGGGVVGPVGGEPAWPRPSGVRGGPRRARPCPCRRRRPGRPTGSGGGGT